MHCHPADQHALLPRALPHGRFHPSLGYGGSHQQENQTDRVRGKSCPVRDSTLEFLCWPRQDMREIPEQIEKALAAPACGKGRSESSEHHRVALTVWVCALYTAVHTAVHPAHCHIGCALLDKLDCVLLYIRCSALRTAQCCTNCTAPCCTYHSAVQTAHSMLLYVLHTVIQAACCCAHLRAALQTELCSAVRAAVVRGSSFFDVPSPTHIHSSHPGSVAPGKRLLHL